MKTTRNTRKPRRGMNIERIAGRTFTKSCAEHIAQVAKQRNQSPTAVIVDVLEAWAKRRGRKRQQSG